VKQATWRLPGVFRSAKTVTGITPAGVTTGSYRKTIRNGDEVGTYQSIPQ